MISGTLTELVAAALVFVGSHFLFSAGPVRRALGVRLGEWGFIGLYSVIALAGFVWMNQAYARAPVIGLCPRMDWAFYTAMVVMLPASVLLACGVLTPNPTALGGGRVLGRDDPAPGIFKITRHPVMWAVFLWAGLHVLNAAHAAALIFFGALGILALGGMAHMDARRNRDGGGDWQRLVACTSFIPFVAIAERRARSGLAGIGWTRMGLGVAIYGALLSGHEGVVGVTPW